jgi:alkaline phosphatase D
MRRRALPALALAGCAAAQGQDRFGLGVASGDPWPDGVVLWTRLDPAPAGAAEVRWQVAHDEGFSRIAAEGVAVARPALGHAVHVEVGGLEPGRVYFYRFHLAGGGSRTGRTRTAPALGSGDAVRFVAASCQNYEHGYFTAWRHIAAEELDFVFFAGDYIYEYGGRAVGSVGGWGPVVRSHDGPETLTLTQYRDRYAQYRRDPDLQAAHAAHPFIVSFDDHEVDNNWAGVHPRATSLTQGDFAARKAAAFQAWYEHMPVRAPQLPAGDAITAYRRFRFGRDMALHVLDTRSYRDDQPCGDGVKPECEAVARPDAQMLGAAQEAWLLGGARGPGLHVLAQQVFVAPRLYPNGNRSMDSWDGYPAARARMLAGLHGQGVANPVFLTGDVHRAWAAEVPGGGPGGGAAQASEFVCTSITSEGDGLEALANAPAFLSGNPHFRFHHARRGYTRFSAQAGLLLAEFRAIAYVSRPDAPVATVGRFGTQSRAPGIAPA